MPRATRPEEPETEPCDCCEKDCACGDCPDCIAERPRVGGTNGNPKAAASPPSRAGDGGRTNVRGR